MKDVSIITSEKLTPTDVRVSLYLRLHKQQVTSTEISDAVHMHPVTVRTSLKKLHSLGLIDLDFGRTGRGNATRAKWSGQ